MESRGCCDLEKVNTIEVRDVGQTVERTTIRRGNINIVMACIRQRGAKAAKQRLENAISKVSRLADIPCKTRLVERGAEPNLCQSV